MTRKALSAMSVAALAAAVLLLVASTPARSFEVAEVVPEETSAADVNPLMPGRRLLGSKCDKCNVPVASGGCKCNNNCDCIADKCAKCNLPVAQGGFKCNNNCDCIAADKCAKCNVPVAQGGCKCDNNCDCLSSGPATTPTSAPTSSGTVLYSGSSSGTYYYDLRTRCPADPASGYPETNGYPACTSWTPGPNQQTLRQLGSNNVVAIDAGLVSPANRARYCGKKVLVFKNGRQVAAPDGGDFFVWDGCDACRGGGRIDFSVSGLRNVDPNACSLGVVPGVTFQVVDVQVRKFVP